MDSTIVKHYAAILNQDASVDGRLFVGIRPTGIYCRPICHTNIPKLEDCAFYLHAAAAEKAGFSPCLMCRPELAPGDAKVDAKSKLARLALRRIEDGALNAKTLEELASEFGVYARDIRRATMREFGLTPLEIGRTQNLLYAKQMLTETNLSTADIAETTGFGDERRLVRQLRTNYHLSPRMLRKNISSLFERLAPTSFPETISFRVDYRPPLPWKTLLMFLGDRAMPGVEAVHEDTYLRTVQVGSSAGWIAVTPLGCSEHSSPINALRVVMSDTLRPVCVTVLTRIKTLFDTRANTVEIDAHLITDPLLTESIKNHCGMRLPGAYDSFELLLRAILGQQVSVKGATTLAGRMVQIFGKPICTPWPKLTRLSPDVRRIVGATVDQVAGIGMPKKRAEAIRTVAKAVLTGDLALVPGGDPDIVRDQLLEFPGIGEWTASYVAMRVLAWPDAFPIGDLGLKKILNMTRPSDILARTNAWKPWRAYAAIYLWLSLSG